MTVRTSVALACALALAGPAAARNLVANGGFEQPPAPPGSFTSYTADQNLGGWTVEDGGVDQVHFQFWQAREGTQSVDLNGSDLGGVRQTIATQPGRLYEISYAVAGNPGCTPGFRTVGVHWGGSVAGSASVDSTTASTTAMGWRIPPALRVQATSSTTVVAFRGLFPIGGCGPALDRVEVVERPAIERGVELVSRSLTGTTGSRFSEIDGQRWTSVDGRYVLFASGAADLVPGDGNGFNDVFVRDLQAGTTELVSRAAGTTTSPNHESYPAGISGDGRYVVFSSVASNLATSGPNPPPNAGLNLWWHDRTSRATRLVSIGAGGEATGARTLAEVSDDGRWVAFTSDGSNVVAAPPVTARPQLYLRDMTGGITRLVSRNVAGTDGGNDRTDSPTMSRDGRWLAFESYATDLVAAPDTNGDRDVFVYDRDTDTLVLASRTSTGSAGSDGSTIEGISDSGDRIVFLSEASNLGPNDTNGRDDAFAYRTFTGEVSTVSCGTPCTATGNGPTDGLFLSADGRYATFASESTNLVPGDANGLRDVFVRDLDTGVTELASVGAADHEDMEAWGVSGDGRWVLFTTNAPDVTVDDTTTRIDDAFVRDRAAGRTYLVSRGEHGASDKDVIQAVISRNGRYVLLTTEATTLTGATDTNDDYDLFAVDLTQVDRLFGDGFE